MSTLEPVTTVIEIAGSEVNFHARRIVVPPARKSPIQKISKKAPIKIKYTVNQRTPI